MQKITPLAAVLIISLALFACSSDDGGGTSGGSGATKNESTTAEATVARAVEDVETEPQGAASAAGSDNFSLLFVQDVQPCASCGIWFESAELVIQHSAGTFRKSKSGGLLIKKASGRQGSFQADLSSIPPSASIANATLYMRLDPHEGIANSDNSSVITVYDTSSGKRGSVVRKITAAGDIKGRGYSKGNPNVPFDFTAYAQQIHGR